ncbi:MAG: hypothetical protein V1897_07330 [Pseudomonadota bacterium]
MVHFEPLAFAQDGSIDLNVAELFPREQGKPQGNRDPRFEKMILGNYFYL